LKSNQYIFLKPLTDKKDQFIKLEFIVNNNKIYVSDFIRSYIVSNFWKGKFFIKNLIKRIFKYRLKEKFIWNRTFWNQINILNMDYNYTLPENIPDLETLKAYLEKNTKPKRLKDIQKYQELIKNNVDINLPLFISGKALNLLGAIAKDNELFFLDGSRRLLANILNDNLTNKALLIDIK